MEKHSSPGSSSAADTTDDARATAPASSAHSGGQRRRNPALRVGAALLTHWQVLAAGGLLATGVVGLSNSYEDYCGQTDLAYAPAEVHGAIDDAAARSGFRAGVIAAQLETESHWRTDVSSHAGAKGLAQFTDVTWEQFGEGGNVLDPQDAIEAQGRYLAYLKERLRPLAHSDQELQNLVLAAYNAGPTAVEHHKGIPPYGETQEYVKKINSLAGTKYKVTCTPDSKYTQEELVSLNG